MKKRREIGERERARVSESERKTVNFNILSHSRAITLLFTKKEVLVSSISMRSIFEYICEVNAFPAFAQHLSGKVSLLCTLNGLVILDSNLK